MCRPAVTVDSSAVEQAKSQARASCAIVSGDRQPGLTPAPPSP